MANSFDYDKPYTRTQLIAVVEMILAAAFDKIESALPTSQKTVTEEQVSNWNKRKEELENFIEGASATVGIFIPILWAQTEGRRIGDGMGTQDFVGWEEWENMVGDYVTHHTTPGNETIIPPAVRPLATKIVDEEWKGYF